MAGPSLFCKRESPNSIKFKVKIRGREIPEKSHSSL
jgi:hypothetical protein